MLTMEASAALRECGGSGPGHLGCSVPLQACDVGSGAVDPGFQRAGRSPTVGPHQGR